MPCILGFKVRQIIGLAVYGGSERINAVTSIVKDAEELAIGDNLKVRFVRLCRCMCLVVRLISFIDVSRRHVIHETQSVIMLLIPLIPRRLCSLGMLFDL